MDVRVLATVLWLRRCLREHDSWTRPQLAAHQARALHLLREYACAHSPFYSRFHRGLTNRPLHELPVLTKALLMEHFDGLVTDQAIRLHDVEAYLKDSPGNDRFSRSLLGQRHLREYRASRGISLQCP